MVTDKQAVDLTKEGWDFVFQQGAMLALMPIEDWLEAFSKAETIAPISDPTLYRDYIYSGKGEVIQNVLRAALGFKRAILKAQEQVLSDGRLQR